MRGKKKRNSVFVFPPTIVIYSARTNLKIGAQESQVLDQREHWHPSPHINLISPKECLFIWRSSRFLFLFSIKFCFNHRDILYLIRDWVWFILCYQAAGVHRFLEKVTDHWITPKLDPWTEVFLRTFPNHALLSQGQVLRTQFGVND